MGIENKILQILKKTAIRSCNNARFGLSQEVECYLIPAKVGYKTLRMYEDVKEGTDEVVWHEN